MSAFSDFIRNATPEEKEKVYMEVMEKASKAQQRKLLESAARGLGKSAEETEELLKRLAAKGS